MRLAFCSLVVISFALLLCASALCEFLPEPNGDEFGLEHGESIAGIPGNPVEIDGKLDDWKHAVWIAFDSEADMLRGQEVWQGVDDLSVVWSTMYDGENFYFAAAVTDDMFTPSPNAAEPWRGDCIFLFIDWENAKAQVSGKPNLALLDDVATVTDFSAAPDPQLGESEIAIAPNEALGEAGMVYEVAMPFDFLTTVEIVEGSEIGFTPGYEEGTDDMEGKGGMVFMDWGGVDPDDPANLGKLIFGGLLPADTSALEPSGKLTAAWGYIKVR